MINKGGFHTDLSKGRKEEKVKARKEEGNQKRWKGYRAEKVGN